MSYKLVNDNITNELIGVTFTDTKNNKIKMIPKDESNTDYQEYLEWVEAGNTAEEAD
tara:strand:- start:717 stop:887 length:171 start_codon:yes stop_codon:yes gene_type:complete